MCICCFNFFENQVDSIFFKNINHLNEISNKCKESSEYHQFVGVLVGFSP
jgi:hypothetical protein